MLTDGPVVLPEGPVDVSVVGGGVSLGPVVVTDGLVVLTEGPVVLREGTVDVSVVGGGVSLGPVEVWESPGVV